MPAGTSMFYFLTNVAELVLKTCQQLKPHALILIDAIPQPHFGSRILCLNNRFASHIVNGFICLLLAKAEFISCSNNIFWFDVKILKRLNSRVVFIYIGDIAINFEGY